MQKIWVVVYVLTFLISSVFIERSVRQLGVYFSLDGTAKATLIDLKVEEKDSSSFALLVSYRFWDGEKEVFGASELAKPYFLNPLSAQSAAEELSKKEWDVFYSRDNSEKNSLQKIFPFKICIQAILTLGVFAYFIVLRKMLRRFT